MASVFALNSSVDSRVDGTAPLHLMTGDRDQHDLLRSLYEQRLKKIANSFRESLERMRVDGALQTLAADPASAAFLPARVEEIVEACLSLEREGSIHLLQEALAAREASFREFQRTAGAGARLQEERYAMLQKQHDQLVIAHERHRHDANQQLAGAAANVAAANSSKEAALALAESRARVVQDSSAARAAQEDATSSLYAQLEQAAAKLQAQGRAGEELRSENSQLRNTVSRLTDEVSSYRSREGAALDRCSTLAKEAETCREALQASRAEIDGLQRVRGRVVELEAALSASRQQAEGWHTKATAASHQAAAAHARASALARAQEGSSKTEEIWRSRFEAMAAEWKARTADVESTLNSRLREERETWSKRCAEAEYALKATQETAGRDAQASFAAERREWESRLLDATADADERASIIDGEVAAAAETISALDATVTHLRTQLAGQAQATERAVNDATEYANLVSRLSSDAQASSARVANLQTALNSAHADVEVWAEQVRANREQAAAADVRAAELYSELITYRRVVAMHKDEISLLTQQLEASREAFVARNNEFSGLAGQYTETRDAYDELQTDFNEVVARAGADYSAVKTRLQSAEAEVERLQLAVAAAEGRREDEEEEAAIAAQDTAMQLAVVRGIAADLQSELEYARLQGTAASAHASAQETELNKLHARMTELENARTDMENDLISVFAEAEDAAGRVKEAESALFDCEDRLEDAAGRAFELAALYEEAESALDDHRGTEYVLQEEISSLRDEAERLGRALTESEKRGRDALLQAEATGEAGVRDLQDGICTLSAEVDMLRAQLEAAQQEGTRVQARCRGLEEEAAAVHRREASAAAEREQDGAALASHDRALIARLQEEATVARASLAAAGKKEERLRREVELMAGRLARLSRGDVSALDIAAAQVATPATAPLPSLADLSFTADPAVLAGLARAEALPAEVAALQGKVEALQRDLSAARQQRHEAQDDLQSTLDTLGAELKQAHDAIESTETELDRAREDLLSSTAECRALRVRADAAERSLAAAEVSASEHLERANAMEQELMMCRLTSSTQLTQAAAEAATSLSALTVELATLRQQLEIAGSERNVLLEESKRAEARALAAEHSLRAAEGEIDAAHLASIGSKAELAAELDAKEDALTSLTKTWKAAERALASVQCARESEMAARDGATAVLTKDLASARGVAEALQAELLIAQRELGSSRSEIVLLQQRVYESAAEHEHKTILLSAANARCAALQATLDAIHASVLRHMEEVEEIEGEEGTSAPAPQVPSSPHLSLPSMLPRKRTFNSTGDVIEEASPSPLVSSDTPVQTPPAPHTYDSAGNPLTISPELDGGLSVRRSLTAAGTLLASPLRDRGRPAAPPAMPPTSPGRVAFTSSGAPIPIPHEGAGECVPAMHEAVSVLHHVLIMHRAARADSIRLGARLSAESEARCALAHEVEATRKEERERQDRVTTMQRELDRLQAEFGKLEPARRMAEEAMAECAAVRQELDARGRALASAQQAHVQAETRCSDLSADVARLQVAVDLSQSEYTFAREQGAESETSLFLARDEATKAAEDARAAYALSADLQAQVNDLKAALTDAEIARAKACSDLAENMRLSAEVQAGFDRVCEDERSRRHELDKVREEVERVRAQRAKAEADRTAAREELFKTSQLLTTSQAELKEALDACALVRIDMTANEADLISARQAVTRTQKEMGEAAEDVSALKSELATLQGELDASEAAVAAVHAEMEELRSTVALLRQEKADMGAENEAIFAQKEAALAGVHSLLLDRDTALSSLGDENVALKSEAQDLKGSLVAANAELQSLQRDLPAIAVESETARAQLQQLRDQLVEKALEVSKLRVNLAESVQQSDEVQSRLEAIQAEAQAATEEIEARAAAGEIEARAACARAESAEAARSEACAKLEDALKSVADLQRAALIQNVEAQQPAASDVLARAEAAEARVARAKDKVALLQAECLSIARQADTAVGAERAKTEEQRARRKVADGKAGELAAALELTTAALRLLDSRGMSGEYAEHLAAADAEALRKILDKNTERLAVRRGSDTHARLEALSDRLTGFVQSRSRRPSNASAGEGIALGGSRRSSVASVSSLESESGPGADGQNKKAREASMPTAGDSAAGLQRGGGRPPSRPIEKDVARRDIVASRSTVVSPSHEVVVGLSGPGGHVHVGSPRGGAISPGQALGQGSPTGMPIAVGSIHFDSGSPVEGSGVGARPLARRVVVPLPLPVQGSITASTAAPAGSDTPPVSQSTSAFIVVTVPKGQKIGASFVTFVPSSSPAMQSADGGQLVTSGTAVGSLTPRGVAEKAGVGAGWLLIRVNGVDVTEMDMEGARVQITRRAYEMTKGGPCLEATFAPPPGPPQLSSPKLQVNSL